LISFINQFERTNSLAKLMLAAKNTSEVIGFWDGLSPRNVWEGLFSLASSGSQIALPLK
jgi:hypothetical protein